jgi:hypothetical protein
MGFLKHEEAVPAYGRLCGAEKTFEKRAPRSRVDSVRYKAGRSSGWLSAGMRKLIEYDHLSIDGRFSGDDWWAAQMKVAPNDNHVGYQLRLLEQASGLVLGRP